jgi:hypothetical protein
VAGGAAGLGQHRPLNAAEHLQYLVTSIRLRQDPESSDDHANDVLRDPCRVELAPGEAAQLIG